MTEDEVVQLAGMITVYMSAHFKGSSERDCVKSAFAIAEAFKAEVEERQAKLKKDE